MRNENEKSFAGVLIPLAGNLIQEHLRGYFPAAISYNRFAKPESRMTIRDRNEFTFNPKMG